MEKKNEQLKLRLEMDKEYARELREEENAVEAVLFAMGRGVELSQLALALESNETAAAQACERLRKRYDAEKRGIIIQRFENSYQMSTSADYYENLIRVAANPKKPVLTDVVLETLSIIAYRQPVTKAEIERIRGVKSDHAVNRLVEYDLVYEVGRLDAPGRPALFGTTEEFLRRFGVSALDNLPGVKPEVEAEIEAEVKEEVSEALGEAVELEGVRLSDGEAADAEYRKAASEPDAEHHMQAAAGQSGENGENAMETEAETDTETEAGTDTETKAENKPETVPEFVNETVAGTGKDTESKKDIESEIEQKEMPETAVNTREQPAPESQEESQS